MRRITTREKPSFFWTSLQDTFASPITVGDSCFRPFKASDGTKFTTKLEDHGIIHPLLVGGDDGKHWCPNDDAKNAKTRAGRVQRDPTCAAAYSRYY